MIPVRQIGVTVSRMDVYRKDVIVVFNNPKGDHMGAETAKTLDGIGIPSQVILSLQGIKFPIKNLDLPKIRIQRQLKFFHLMFPYQFLRLEAVVILVFF